LEVLEYIQYDENKPRAAKAADISIEKHILLYDQKAERGTDELVQEKLFERFITPS